MLNLQQKLRMGIPLTPEEQAQMGQTPQPMRTDPLQNMASLPQGGPSPGNDPDPNQQFTTGELGDLGELGMFDERQDQIGRKMAMAQKLREGTGGPRGGTYGRWGTPMPYSKGEAIVNGLSQAGGAFMQRRAEKEATANREKAQKTLGMYEERTRNPRDRVAQSVAQDLSGIKPPQAALGAQSPWEKIKAAGKRYF